jgi:hypothetical protein
MNSPWEGWWKGWIERGRKWVKKEGEKKVGEGAVVEGGGKGSERELRSAFEAVMRKRSNF